MGLSTAQARLLTITARNSEIARPFYEFVSSKNSIIS